MDKRFYVYIHYKKGTNEPFYVGKGSNRRAFVIQGRSAWWTRIVDKHGLHIEIIDYFDTEVEAFNRERSMIASMAASGLELCNLTAGGEGLSGMLISEDTRRKLSVALTGKIVSDSARENMSRAAMGRKLSDGAKEKIAKALTGRVLSEESRSKLSSSLKKVDHYWLVADRHHSFKGEITAYNETTGSTLVFKGNHDMIAQGFEPSNVYNCLNGKRKTHKGYTFTR